MSAALNHSEYIPSETSFNVPQVGTISQSEVGSEVEKLTTQCLTLEKQIAELAQRLGPVLRQLPQGNTGSTSTPEPVLVPLAQTLHERVKHLSGLSDQLASVINRVEL